MVIDIEQVDQIRAEEVKYPTDAMSSGFVPEYTVDQARQVRKPYTVEINVRDKVLLVQSRRVLRMSHTEELDTMTSALEQLFQVEHVPLCSRAEVIVFVDEENLHDTAA